MGTNNLSTSDCFVLASSTPATVGEALKIIADCLTEGEIMTQIEDNKSNIIINTAQAIFNDDVDMYLDLCRTKTSKELLADTEEKINRSLLTFLGVVPETDDVFYSGKSQTPTVNLGESLSVTIYNGTYYFIRQDKETQEVDYYAIFSDDDYRYKEIKREIDIIYPGNQNKGKQKTFGKIE